MIALRSYLVFLGVLALGAAACETFVGTVSGREPFVPLPIYPEWWAATETCSGLSGDFSRITWYTALSITGDGRVAMGRWSAPHDIIIVRGHEENELTVRHEMLHDLLDGDGDHSDPTWVTCDLLPR